MNKMLKVYTIEDSKEKKFLRKKTDEVSKSQIEDKEFQTFIDNLIYTAQEFESEDGYLSVGLAAIQVGKKYKLFAFYREDIQDFEVMINPEIEIVSPIQEIEKEGCLSIPGVEGKVARFRKIRVRYLDRNGEKKRETFTGMDAREIQHEYDHTQGILFTDKLVD